MEQSASQKLPVKRASRLRRSLLMFLALTYLFVGFAHTVVCIDQAVAATGLVHVVAAADNSGDGSPNDSAAVAEHCHVCAPVLASVSVPVALPSSHFITSVFVAPPHLLAEHVRLDTPPPKSLT